MGIKIILNLFGGVALLLWGLRMVHLGIVRAFGARLRIFLSTILKNRFNAFLAGIGVTALLQSSTATALMVSSFSASGIINLVPALAIMLGANVGTTLIVQLLSFDTSVVAPILILMGVMVFKRAQRSIYRDLSKVSIGLGLMLLSLHLLLTSLAPAENAPVMHEALAFLTNDPLLTLLLGALFTWAAHSSVATVLLTISLAGSNFIHPSAALALVLGANLGSALNPMLEGLSSKNPADRRMPIGNFINRLIGCIIFLPLISPMVHWFGLFEPSTVRMTADFHTLFNVALALLFIIPLPAFARLLEFLLPDIKEKTAPETPVYLDEKALPSPTIALTCAARETLRMGDLVDEMLQGAITALFTNDLDLANKISDKDHVIDSLNESIKLYVIKITHDSLDEDQGQRAMEILSLAINLEHIGDIIDKNLLEVARRKVKHQLEFSEQGAIELRSFYTSVHENLRLALSVFLSGDVRAARTLLDEKHRIRDLEITASDNHFQRLRNGNTASVDSSSLHLELLRDLKRIHSHICSVAYPALEASGELPRLSASLIPPSASSK